MNSEVKLTYTVFFSMLFIVLFILGLGAWGFIELIQWVTSK